MPAQPAWFLRLPEILEAVRALRTPVVDRAGFERLFQVRRRRAIELMHRFGGYQAGKTFLIDRGQLIAELDRAVASPDYTFEFRRKQRLAESIEQLERHRAAARVTIPRASLAPLDTSLPPDVHLEAGRLTVDFATPDDLLSKLFLFSQKIAGDFEGMCKRISSS
jgi:hypothetical protein